MRDDTLQTRISLPLDRFFLELMFVTRAKVTGIFGASGSGKTSFLEVIAGLRRTSMGKIVFGSVVWQDSDQKIFLPPEKRGIGYVPQSGLLFPHHSVIQNLCAGARRSRIQDNDTNKTTHRVIELLELKSILNRNVRTLSGGESQRVVLGRALCSAPQLLLLDEPLSSLDQPLRRRILPFLKRIREEFDLPMIMVSHDPVEVTALCDDMVLLHEGKIIAQGLPRELLTHTTYEQPLVEPQLTHL